MTDLEQPTSRRSFLHAASMAGAGLWAGQAACRTESDPGAKPGGSLPSSRFDCVVVGGTPGGIAAAVTVARMGRSVALVEENALRRAGPEIELELDQIGDRPSGEVADDHPLVERALAVMPLFGAVPALTRSSTDSNIPISLGIPAVTIGSGGIGMGAHSPGEWWINRNGHLGIQANLLLLVSEAGLAEPIP